MDLLGPAPSQEPQTQTSACPSTGMSKGPPQPTSLPSAYSCSSWEMASLLLPGALSECLSPTHVQSICKPSWFGSTFQIWYPLTSHHPLVPWSQLGPWCLEQSWHIEVSSE